MSYRHQFHAGNFADVFKHALLCLALRHLGRKEGALCYLESHAGAGRYDLTSAAAQRSGEYRTGIGRLWDAPGPHPAGLAEYVAAVRAVNPPGELRCYPGSPRLARNLLRPQDRMVLMELHPQELRDLRRELRGDTQAHIHHRDGYEGINALLPPREQRGLLLIDPPYEDRNEMVRAVAALADVRRRWSTGRVLLWYPLKDHRATARFHRDLVASGLRRLLVAELEILPRDVAGRLHGCGLVLLNPSWGLVEDIRLLLPALQAALGQGGGGASRLEWLAAE